MPLSFNWSPTASRSGSTASGTTSKSTISSDSRESSRTPRSQASTVEDEIPEELRVLPRVLSIQSQVVHGAVGNRCAVFPLQLLGFDVDVINTVQFAHHPAYKHFRKGQTLDCKELHQIVSLLRKNQLDKYDYVISGYVMDDFVLREIKDAIISMKERNPSLVYLCDPVLGDNGKLYVPESLVEIYKNEILPIADIITPNQFEAELLSGIEICLRSDVIEALGVLHTIGPCVVVITSVEIPSTPLGQICGFSSARTANEKGESRCVMKLFRVPKFDARFVGTGDLFSSLLLAWHHKQFGSMTNALTSVLTTMQAIMETTITRTREKARREVLTPADYELRIVECRRFIETPPNNSDVIVEKFEPASF